MTAREIPVVFECGSDRLVGVVHVPEQVATRGLLQVVAGGPQYRSGMSRMGVRMARQLADGGTPVMRFDQRGIGDSEGEFRGFHDLEADLQAAIRAFLRTIPELKEVTLWGGCDAATAVAINGWKFPQVTGLALGNPWILSQATAAGVEMQHYGRRWRDPSFWKKVVRLQYNPLPALRTIGTSLLVRLGLARAARSSLKGKADDTKAPYLDRMRNGLASFKGDVLLMMSGKSLYVQQFDLLVATNIEWQKAMRGPRHVARHDMPDADQAFSTLNSRDEVTQTIAKWLSDVRGVGHSKGHQA
jgi:exosortase A-associated hydrolase 1